MFLNILMGKGICGAIPRNRIARTVLVVANPKACKQVVSRCLVVRRTLSTHSQSRVKIGIEFTWNRVILGTGTTVALVGTCTAALFGFGSIVVADSPTARQSASVEVSDRVHPTMLDPSCDDRSAQKIAFDWAKFWQLLRPDMFLLLGAVVSALVVALVNIQIPVLLGDLVNALSRLTVAGEVTTEASSVVKWPLDVLYEMRAPTLRLIYFYGIQGIFTFAYVSLLSVIGERLACRIRKDLFAAIVRLDIAFFDSHKTGELVNRLTTDVQDFKSSFKLCVSQGLRSLAQTVGCFLSLYYISPQMTGVMVVTLPFVVAVGTLMGSFLRRLSRLAGEQVSRATSVADEAIGNIRTVRAFAMENNEIELYGTEVEKAAKLNETLGIGIGVFQGVANVTLNGIVLGVMCMGGYLISTDHLSAGELMSFMVATQTIQRSLAQLSLLFGQFVRGLSAGARVFEYSKLEPIIPLEGGQKIPYHTLHGDLEFRNVTFSYPTRPRHTVLSEFNLKIPAGRTVALCGPSGGGKSTIAALLERFYDVDGGSVTLDDVDIRRLDASWLRGSVIGFINQEPVLFATSVMENIRYGRPDATDREIVEAAIAANADEFIRSFPDGYRTVLGERGVTVSGGQKQRLAIARALLKNPSILILDEATSALDAESEKQVQIALDHVVKGRTVLVIAHRLSTIQNADIIVVLADGIVAEMGTDEALRKRRGLYWNLIAQQQKEEKLQDVSVVRKPL